MRFSLFNNGIKNVTPHRNITIVQFIELLKQDSELIENIRKEQDKDKRDLLKQKLSYVTFGGTFRKRSKKQLIEGSGLACFDIDDVDNLEEIKEKIIRNKYTNLLFISPSGNGLKCIVKIPQIKSDEEYKQYWISIAKHYNLSENDEASKDVSRACYLSIDKEPYFNSESEVYTEKWNAMEKYKGNRYLELSESDSSRMQRAGKLTGYSHDSFIGKLKSKISMESILRNFGVDTSMNPTNCIFHSCSQRCLSFNSEVCNCFDTDCGQGYNIFSFVQKVKGLNSAETIKWLSKFAGMEEEYEKARKDYLNRNKKPMGWACSINIKKMAERHNILNCPKCNIPLKFKEDLGFYKCNSCGMFGGLKKFALLCYKNKLEIKTK